MFLQLSSQNPDEHQRGTLETPENRYSGRLPVSYLSLGTSDRMICLESMSKSLPLDRNAVDSQHVLRFLPISSCVLM